MKNKKFLKNMFLTGALSAFLLSGSPSFAQEAKSNYSVEQSLEQKISTFDMDIIFNYNGESIRTPLNYSNSKTSFDSSEDSLFRNSNNPQLTPEEQTYIEDIIKDIRYGTIASYSDLLEISEELSEDQQLVLLSAIGYLLRGGSYDLNYEDETFSQDDFFNLLQDYLETGDQNSLGVCRHISSYLEQLANDMGIDAAAVSGIDRSGFDHTYDILKIDNGTAIIDYGTIFITNTKNIERTLEAYQKYLGTTTFSHVFFNDTEFMYRLLTKDGKHFLEFVEYDETSQPLKDSLIQDNILSPDITLTYDMNNYLTSVNLDCFGFFIKTGQIKGASSSPLDELNLFQTGFKRDFSIGTLNLNSDLNFVIGNILQDAKIENNNIFGGGGNLVVSTNFEKGLNLASRIAGNITDFIFSSYTTLFSDLNFGAGISYTIPIRNMNMEPYIVSQFSLFPKDIGTLKYAPRFSEFIAGNILNFNSNLDFSADLYYLKRIWEQGCGINTKISNDAFGIDFGGYMTRSNYKFCPHKYGFNIGVRLNSEKIYFEINYGLDGTNYDGEKENESSFGIQADIKF